MKKVPRSYKYEARFWSIVCVSLMSLACFGKENDSVSFDSTKYLELKTKIIKDDSEWKLTALSADRLINCKSDEELAAILSLFHDRARRAKGLDAMAEVGRQIMERQDLQEKAVYLYGKFPGSIDVLATYLKYARWSDKLDLRRPMLDAWPLVCYLETNLNELIGSERDLVTYFYGCAEMMVNRAMGWRTALGLGSLDTNVSKNFDGTSVVLDIGLLASEDILMWAGLYDHYARIMKYPETKMKLPDLLVESKISRAELTQIQKEAYENAHLRLWRIHCLSFRQGTKEDEKLAKIEEDGAAGDAGVFMDSWRRELAANLLLALSSTPQSAQRDRAVGKVVRDAMSGNKDILAKYTKRELDRLPVFQDDLSMFSVYKKITAFDQISGQPDEVKFIRLLTPRQISDTVKGLFLAQEESRLVASRRLTNEFLPDEVFKTKSKPPTIILRTLQDVVVIELTLSRLGLYEPVAAKWLKIKEVP